MTLEEQIGESVWNSYRDIAYLFLEKKEEKKPLPPLEERPWSPQASDDRKREPGKKGAGAPDHIGTPIARALRRLRTWFSSRKSGKSEV